MIQNNLDCNVAESPDELIVYGGLGKAARNWDCYEKILELAIEAGANDCLSHDEYHAIYCNKVDIYNVKKNLEKNINNFISTEIEWIALNSIELFGEQKIDAIKFLENLENDDDVQNVYTNIKK